MFMWSSDSGLTNWSIIVKRSLNPCPPFQRQIFMPNFEISYIIPIRMEIVYKTINCSKNDTLGCCFAPSHQIWYFVILFDSDPLLWNSPSPIIHLFYL